MGREASITYDQVVATVQALKLAGVKPTSRNVRERLGTGSMGTVHKLLQTWRAGRAGDPAAEDVSLPDSLQRAILHYVSTEVETAQATLQTELAEEQHAAAELATENERLHAALADKDVALQTLQSERATLQGRLDEQQAHAKTVQHDLAEARKQAETHRIEVAKVRQQLEGTARLEAALAETRRVLDGERKSRTAAEKQSAVLQARLDAALARADKAEAQLQFLIAQSAAAAPASKPAPDVVPRRRPSK